MIYFFAGVFIVENTNINIGGMDMMGLKKRNKPKESTDVMIKLKISVPDVNNSDSCNVVDLKATYVKEKIAK